MFEATRPGCYQGRSLCCERRIYGHHSYTIGLQRHLPQHQQTQSGTEMQEQPRRTTHPLELLATANTGAMLLHITRNDTAYRQNVYASQAHITVSLRCWHIVPPMWARPSLTISSRQQVGACQSAAPDPARPGRGLQHLQIILQRCDRQNALTESPTAQHASSMPIIICCCALCCAWLATLAPLQRSTQCPAAGVRNMSRLICSSTLLGSTHLA